MSKICVVTGKKPLVGHNVSHANNKTKRRQMPNLQTRTVTDPASGKKYRILVSGRGLRTLNKWLREGKQVDFTQMVA